MIFGHSTSRSFLRSVLVERSRKNAAYSLRAFARDLGLQPSLLSEVMNGKRTLTENSAFQVAQRLDLPATELDYFRELARLDRTENPQLKEQILTHLNGLTPKVHAVHDLGVDHFRMIADWHHFAILKQLELETVHTAKTLSRTFGIHEYEVEAALERLLRLDLIELQASGGYRKKCGNLFVGSQTPHEALRKYHQQMLSKISDTLDTLSPVERFTGTETVLLSAHQLKQAHKIYEECFQKIQRLSEQRGPDAEVHHVAIHQIRLSENQTRNTDSKKRKIRKIQKNIENHEEKS